MAKILADRDIKRLVGRVLVDADEKLLNPNGIELRLGKYVRFHSTGEEKKLNTGMFLQVNPGETVIISSIETIDFTAETVQTILPNTMIMGLITPTTTMMREGISQVATKIDAGFKGILNWGLRNGSIQKLTLQYGEPIFKLTLFALDRDESPDTAYGERDKDSYQNTDGIARSTRRIPADIPKSKIVSSSFDRLDPKKQLKEAGYPFDHIGTELISLHGKFETVSADVPSSLEKSNRRRALSQRRLMTQSTRYLRAPMFCSTGNSFGLLASSSVLFRSCMGQWLFSKRPPWVVN
jgi:deoxycytidine triphosphate deaminase